MPDDHDDAHDQDHPPDPQPDLQLDLQPDLQPDLSDLLAPTESTLTRLFWRDGHEAMQLIDADRCVLAVNPAARAAPVHVPGTPGDPLPDKPVQVLDAAGDPLPKERWPTVVAMAGGTVERAAVTIDLGLGPREVSISTYPVRLRSGDRGALLVWHDVTDSWRPGREEHRELARLRLLLEGATDYALIQLDQAGRVRTWSPGAQRLYGYPEAEILGLPYATLFEPGDRVAGTPQQVLARAGAAGRMVTEGWRVRPDGSRFWARCVVTAIRPQDDVHAGFVMVAHDETERRRAAERVVVLNERLTRLNAELEARVEERTMLLEGQAAQLGAANAELEAFSYSVSHDLRAPLRSIAGFTAILRERYAPLLPAEGLHYLDRVSESATQMGSLIDALLGFSRMQRQSMHLGVVDMNTLVARCWEVLAGQREDRRVSLEVARLPPARGDHRLLQQVWANLLDNALKYTARRDEARIEVFAEPGPPGMNRYLVRDNGAGFDPRYADKLGQVFHRLHRADDFPGTGVGLALVQRILQRHGGRLEATSEPDKGATFSFLVPEV